MKEEGYSKSLQNLYSKFLNLKDLGLDSVLRIYSNTHIPYEYSNVSDNVVNYSILEICIRKVGFFGKVSFETLFSIQISKSTNKIHFKDSMSGTEIMNNTLQKKVHIYKLIEAVKSTGSNSIILKLVKATDNVSLVDLEKIKILVEIDMIQNNKFFSKANTDIQAFLVNFENNLIKGNYDGIFKKAFFTTIYLLILREMIAVIGPIIALSIGAVSNFYFWSAVAAIIYIVAPVPIWLFLQFDRFKKRKSLGSPIEVLLSLVAINIPILGSTVVFPISLNNQTKGEISSIRRLVRKFSNNENIKLKQRFLDLCLFGII